MMRRSPSEMAGPLLVFVLFSIFACRGWGQSSSALKQIDTTKSLITVHVYKAGMFSAFGHEHQIRAPIVQGVVNEENPTVELRVDARQLRVMDKDVSEGDRAKIQQTMLGPLVLDSERFPQILFRTTQVVSEGVGRWRVEGNLTLHGQTRPMRVTVEGGKGRYQGWVELRQRDFAMTPVSVAGGTIKVKNEVRLEFDVYIQ